MGIAAAAVRGRWFVGSLACATQICMLDADNDYAVVQAWLSLRESTAKHRG
jgi:hypothetical protein